MPKAVPVHVCVFGCGSSTVRGSGLCTTVCTERGHGCDVQIIVINENNVMVSSVLLMFK